VKSARQWKAYYADERAELGEGGLAALFERAPSLSVARGSAYVFPHTRLAVSGHFTAAVARAVVRSGADEVVALGILHGAREVDAELVRRAREGAPQARATLRRLHGPGVEGDVGYWSEEFSLDGFCALIELAAKLDGKGAPRVVVRYPFLVGDAPGELHGMTELRALVDRGVPVVATADPIHHGAGYGARDEDRLPREDPQTLEFARWTIERGFRALGSRDYTTFARHAAEVRSDFRDTGPVLAYLLDPARPLDVDLLDLLLVDYAKALDAPAPTWVAGALARFSVAS
jgi:hypothetical protein